MFPITDFSRAADIRMRRRRAGWLLVGIVLLPFMLFSGPTRPGRIYQEVRDSDVDSSALPAGRRDGEVLSASGTSLRVTLDCAQSITLVPQPDLTGHVFVSTRDGEHAGMAGLLLTGSSELVLAGKCPQSSGLVVQLPASMPISMVQVGTTDIRLGAFRGPVHLVQTGSGDVVIDASGPLDIQTSGSGDLSVGHLGGNLHLVGDGSGDLRIAHIQADQVDIHANGSGDVSIQAGHVGNLHAEMHGSGDLSALAAIDTASIQSSDSSDITLPHVKGRLDRSNLPD